MRKPLFKHTHIIRLGRLLNMLYKPAELAAEIHVTSDTIYRSYLPAGLPHTRDSAGRIWINGQAFAAWARSTISQRRNQRKPLPADQAWCVSCGHGVQLVDPRTKSINRYLELLQAACPECGKTVNRARARKTVYAIHSLEKAAP